MNVEQVMTKNGATCLADNTLADAARVMWEQDCGFVPVVESDGSSKLVGVITDRDICMAAYTRGVNLHALRVGEAMARSVQSCAPGDSLGLAEQRMSEFRVRRLPVVDDGGHLLGVLSLSDIAREARRQRRRKKREITDAEVGELLAAISEPRPLSGSNA
jgi:CBS domain-containing protein